MKTLIVSGTQPSKDQGHLLSCSGQLKTSLFSSWSIFMSILLKPKKSPAITLLGESTVSKRKSGERAFADGECWANKTRFTSRGSTFSILHLSDHHLVAPMLQDFYKTIRVVFSFPCLDNQHPSNPIPIHPTTVLSSSMTGSLFPCDQCEYTNVSKPNFFSTKYFVSSVSRKRYLL